MGAIDKRRGPQDAVYGAPEYGVLCDLCVVAVICVVERAFFEGFDVSMFRCSGVDGMQR